MKKLTFHDFREQAQEMFSAFKEHSTMYDLRVWDTYPYDILHDRKCWYVCVRLSEGVQMMITYDPSDDDQKPFVCWYDYEIGTTTYSHWAFATLEEAMLFICNEPHRNYRTTKRDTYVLCRPTQYADGRKAYQKFLSTSLLSIIDYINANYNDIPDGEWDLKVYNIFRQPEEGDTIYRLKINSGRKNTFPFWWNTTSPFPEWIYTEIENPFYYE